MIAEDARTALLLEASFTADTPRSALVRRARARLAERVITMLGVPPAHVAVTGDLLHRYGTWPGAVATVDEPVGNDPATAARYRFLARPGPDDTAMLLLDECPDCDGPSVPVAEIETLADLGRYLAAMGRLAYVDTGEPIDAAAPPVPAEYFGDPGHNPSCPAATLAID